MTASPNLEADYDIELGGIVHTNAAMLVIDSEGLWR